MCSFRTLGTKKGAFSEREKTGFTTILDYTGENEAIFFSRLRNSFKLEISQVPRQLNAGVNKIIFRHARFPNITLKLTQKSNRLPIQRSKTRKLTKDPKNRSLLTEGRRIPGGRKKCQAHNSATYRELRRPQDGHLSA